MQENPLKMTLFIPSFILTHICYAKIRIFERFRNFGAPRRASAGKFENPDAPRRAKRRKFWNAGAPRRASATKFCQISNPGDNVLGRNQNESKILWTKVILLKQYNVKTLCSIKL